MDDQSNPLLRRLAGEPRSESEYEPLQLWLLPVLLRTREQFYRDAIAAVQREIDEAWERHGRLYRNRQEFDNSDFVRGMWQRASPFWWGLNDIVGYIDIRVNLAAPAVEASLFLTHKRASRALVDRKFVYRERELVPLVGGQTNDDLCQKLDAAVTRLCATPSIRHRYVNLDDWRLLLHHTNVMAVILAEIDRLSAPTANR